MEILYTPDQCFADIPDYPFRANYVEVGENLRMHYIDEHPADAKGTILLLHGEPSWSFLYRKMIPILVEAGYRCIVPDLIGFGKSAKPTQFSDYSYAKHNTWVQSLIDSLDLQELIFFGQDWGGLIGLRLVAAQTDRYKAIVIANTALPTGDIPMPETFTQWKNFVKNVPVLEVGKIIQMATVSDLSDKVMAAYDAPFPSPAYQAGAKIFPELVPNKPDDPESIKNRNAWKEVYVNWQKPFLTLFSDSDPIMRGGEKAWQKIVPGAQQQPHQIITAGGHFLQEDKGEEIATIMVEWLQNLKK